MIYLSENSLAFRAGQMHYVQCAVAEHTPAMCQLSSEKTDTEINFMAIAMCDTQE